MIKEESSKLQKEIRDHSRSGRYIYGIIKNSDSKSFGRCGINNEEEVYTIAHQDISCVLSNSPLEDYSSMLKETLGHFLVKHQTIIEKIMKEHTIIPMKFGTNISNDDEVINVLKGSYPQFKELLAGMNAKIELDVACTWDDLNSIIKEIGEETKEIKEFKKDVAKKPPNQAFQDKLKIGMMIKEALDKRREREQAHIIDSLKSATFDFQKHQIMDDKMILNCAFLLEKSKESDFDAKVKELDKEYKQKVNFRCIGPLPPYSFATCQIKKIGYTQIDEAKGLLGLGEKISLKEIKNSYRQSAQKNHPDKDLNNSHLKDEFEKITRAYKLLSDCCQGRDIVVEDKQGEDLILVEITRP